MHVPCVFFMFFLGWNSKSIALAILVILLYISLPQNPVDRLLDGADDARFRWAEGKARVGLLGHQESVPSSPSAFLPFGDKAGDAAEQQAPRPAG